MLMNGGKRRKRLEDSVIDPLMMWLFVMSVTGAKQQMEHKN